MLAKNMNTCSRTGDYQKVTPTLAKYMNTRSRTGLGRFLTRFLTHQDIELGKNIKKKVERVSLVR
jgi:hypothetical protein